MARTPTNLSLDPTLKAQASALFADLGMDLSTAINLFLRQAVRMQGLPFRVTRIPSAETLAAMQETEDIIAGRAPARGYASAEEMMADILSEADDADD